MTENINSDSGNSRPLPAFSRVAPREVRRFLARFVRAHPSLLARGCAISVAAVALFLAAEWTAFVLIAAHVSLAPSSEAFSVSDSLRAGWWLISLMGTAFLFGVGFFGMVGRAWYEVLVVRAALDSFSGGKVPPEPTRAPFPRRYMDPLLRWGWLHAWAAMPLLLQRNRGAVHRARAALGGCSWGAGTYFVVPLSSGGGYPFRGGTEVLFLFISGTLARRYRS